jgi:hypothetical protein
MNRTAALLAGLLVLCLLSAAVARLRHRPHAPLARLTIEVLNGCGEEGAAAEAARQLRSLGQDVVKVEDADRLDYPQCVLVDRSGRPWLARRLAHRLGDMLVVLERRADTAVELTLIVGKDHAAHLRAPQAF